MSAGPVGARIASWGAGLAVGVGALVLLRPLGPIAEHWGLVVPAVAVVLFLHDRWGRLGRTGRGVAAGALAGMACVVAIRVVRYAYERALDPPLWDFDAFWIAARVAAAHLNYYDPAALHALAGPIHVDREFVAEILDVGYWYPPPSILLIAPFGLLERPAAGAAWTAMIAISFVIAGVALWRAFTIDRGRAGLGIAVLLLAIEPGTRGTLYRAQTNLILLFWMVLFWHHRERRLAGLWLALACLTKPIAVVLYGYALARRRWGAMALSVAVLAAATVVTGIVFGWAPIASYLAANPASRFPDYVFTQVWNQSAPGLIMRVMGSAHGLARVAALGVSAVITVVTLLRVFARNTDDALRLALVVAGGALAYPGTLGHYSVVLILPIMLLWSRRALLPGGAVLGIVVASGAYGLVAAFPGGGFAATALVWAALVVLTGPAWRSVSSAERVSTDAAGA